MYERHSQTAKARRTALQICIVYAALGSCYIVASDLGMFDVVSHGTPRGVLDDIVLASAGKGVSFVLVTALLLYLVLRRSFTRLAQQTQMADEAVRASDQIVDALPDIYFELDMRSRISAANQRACEVTGLPIEQIVGRPAILFVAEDDRAAVERSLTTLIENGERQVIEARLLLPDGTSRTYLWNTAPRLSATGTVIGAIGIGVDIANLHASGAGFRYLFVANPVPMFVYDWRTRRMIDANDAALKLYGYSRREFLALTALDLPDKPDREKVDAYISSLVPGRFSQSERHHFDKSGARRDVSIMSARVDFDGRDAVLAVIRDSTGEKRLERELEEAIDAISDGFIMYDANNRLVRRNRRWLEMFAPIADVAVPGASFDDVVRATAERGLVDDAAPSRDAYIARRAADRRQQRETEVRYGDRWYLFRDQPTPDGGTVGIRTDITDLKTAQLELARRADILAAAGRLAQMGYWRLAFDWRTFEASDELRTMIGFAGGEAAPSADMLLEFCDDRSRSELELALTRAFDNGEPFQIRARSEGNNVAARLIWIEGQAERDMTGNVVAVFGIVQDITEREEVERRLIQYQETLARTQRMDAIGQLTGGIAHDFNNLLMVVLGNLDMLQERINLDDTRQVELVDIARQAAERGSSLTRRLLAYSRQQSLSASECDINDVLTRSIGPLLKHTLPETIEVHLDLADQPLTVFVDEHELETAILNLALNSRDAMRRGGRILVRTEALTLDADFTTRHGAAPAKAGRYVRLSVTDTGEGIATDQLDRVFEPFFTTKEVGHGTGLGLSMVYGFVTQSGGFIDIYSEPDQGTAVKLYFPVAEAGATADTARESSDAPRAAKAGARILIVEDEIGVRELLKEFLSGAGYDVEAAIHALEAKEWITAGGRYDLLISDVVLPKGMSGPELVDFATEAIPGLKVVFMSGYPRLPDGSMIDTSEVTLLEKPFSMTRLLTVVETALADE